MDLTCENGDVTMSKHVTVQLPMLEEEDEKDTELVVVRYRDASVQVRYEYHLL